MLNQHRHSWRELAAHSDQERENEVLDRILADMDRLDRHPLVKGGQGREPESLVRDASISLWLAWFGAGIFVGFIIGLAGTGAIS